MRVPLLLLLLAAQAATPPQNQPSSPAPEQGQPPRGTVIFQKEEKPAPAAEEQPASALPQTEPSSAPVTTSKPDPPDAEVSVQDAERDAITFTAYDLDLHLTPASGSMEAHANFTARNDGKLPLTHLALQLSSSLVWESLRLRSDAAAAFVQHRINTDADHTGVAREAVLTLPQPLAPGASLNLTAIYSGRVPQSAERLERIGAPAEQAAKADWDTIATDNIALRGYGNVLWYPVSSAPVFLGEGAKLFDAVGRTRLRQQEAIVRLHLTLAYSGDAPDAVYFCGRRESLTILSDTEGLPVAAGSGVATAEFAAQRLGFRIPSLFVADRAVTMTDGSLIRAVTDRTDALDGYAAAAAKAQPLLMEWLGDEPLAPLDVLDHPGQPFEDGSFLVTPLHPAEPVALTPVLVHTLAHSWFASKHAWLDEGVAQFLSLLWIETNDGRQAGLDRLQSSALTLALAEPAPADAKVDAPPGQGQPLVEASTEVYYRTKAAAVLWMLRSITSDDALKQALQLYRRNRTADATAEGFEKVLEETSHEDLRWFFDDWVYHDRGLPDLTIAYVTPRPTPDQGGKSGGYLVGVNVRNDGDAVAEVPVTVRSGNLTATERLRIPGHSNAATRILFQGTPEEVLVNDGSVPEVRGSIHAKKVVVQTQ